TRLRLLWLILACNACLGLLAQHEISSPKYMQTQYFINPAYSATSNTMVASLMARKQWFGLEGSPASYRFASYTPLNNTLMSVGGSLDLEQFGIIKIYTGSLSYAYLVKISPVTFLSLGISAHAQMHQIAFDELNLTHADDPSFSNTTESETILNATSGAYLYSRKFYLGLSVTNLFGSGNSDKYFEINQMQQKRQYYLSSGYTVNPNSWIGIKPSFLVRYHDEEDYNVGGGLQVFFKELFWVGAMYSKNGWMSSSVNVKIPSGLEVGYVFDVAMGNNMINRTGHEIVISYEINSFVKENKNREFGFRKPKKDKTKSSIKSMRNF
ncbi:MAG: PorP/SprF family type IX secretion system membrane protein, partial [Cyclobacteriaceae bacterium]